MVHIEIRPIRNDYEYKCCIELWATVFPEGKAFFQERLDNDNSYFKDSTWIAVLEDFIVASGQIFPYHTWIGQTKIKVGGVGNVATHPDFRGRGLAQSILRQQCKWMKKHGYDMSSLFTGIHSFYEQMDWYRLKELFLSFKPKRAETQKNYKIVEFNPEFLDNIHGIYEEFNFARTRSFIRTKEYWNAQIKWRHEEPRCFLLAKHEDTITGYIRFKVENRILKVQESCYKFRYEDSVAALLNFVIEKHNFDKIETKVPFDHILFQTYRETASVGIDDGEMWKIFDFESLMLKLKPTFTSRVLNSKLSQRVILLRSGEQEILVQTQEHGIKLMPVSNSVYFDEEISLTKQDWATLILQGIDSLPTLKYNQNEVLRTLFPNQSSIFWEPDHF